MINIDIYNSTISYDRFYFNNNKAIEKKNADWCNSNIPGSCPVNRGAIPLSAKYLLKVIA